MLCESLHHLSTFTVTLEKVCTSSKKCPEEMELKDKVPGLLCVIGTIHQILCSKFFSTVCIEKRSAKWSTIAQKTAFLSPVLRSCCRNLPASNIPSRRQLCFLSHNKCFYDLRHIVNPHCSLQYSMCFHIFMFCESRL